MPRCRKRKIKNNNHSNDIFGRQDVNKEFFLPKKRYASNAFKTVCDIGVHPDDYDNALLGNSIRHVGSGIPVVKTLSDGEGLESSRPCTYEALMEHEKVHIKNAKANCKGFKKCLDDEVANNLVASTVTVAEFNACNRDHHGGLAENCEADEKEAYQKTVEVGERLVTESKCAGERTDLENDIKQWKKFVIKPPC